MVPNAFTVCATNSFTLASSATSPVTATAFTGYLSLISSQIRCKSASFDGMSINATSAPSSAKALAVERPIPPAPPVTRAFLPFRERSL